MKSSWRHGSVPARIAAGVLVGCVIVGGFFAGCRSSPTPVRPGSRQPSGTGASSVPSGAWQREADRWIGTPYHRGGDDLGGADCSGFVQQVYRRVAGVELPRITQDQYRAGYEVGRSELKPGDLVFFETAGTGVAHVGLMVGGDRFAHASTSKGVIYSRLAEAYWNERYRGARRLPRRRLLRRRGGGSEGRGADGPGESGGHAIGRANPLTLRKGSQQTLEPECR